MGGAGSSTGVAVLLQLLHTTTCYATGRESQAHRRSSLKRDRTEVDGERVELLELPCCCLGGGGGAGAAVGLSEFISKDQPSALVFSPRLAAQLYTDSRRTYVVTVGFVDVLPCDNFAPQRSTMNYLNATASALDTGLLSCRSFFKG